MKKIRIAVSVIMVTFLIISLIFGSKLNSAKEILTQPESYKGIITCWQVDVFEGGEGSRKTYLLEKARNFEKKNDGVLVMVINKTVEGVKESISQGITPDIISYGTGVEITNLNELDVSREFIGGKIGDKNYAVPWCRGGYVLIGNKKLTSEIPNQMDELIVSQAEYTQPLTSLYLEGITAKNYLINTPFDAYVMFTQGKIPYFLGTQRDINRLNCRGMEVIARPLTKFNDLYQYVSLTTKDSVKRYYAEQFIDYLLSENVQNSLDKIKMLSPYIQAETELEHLKAMAQITGFSTISVFTSARDLQELKSLSLKAIQGDSEAQIKIKNIII